MKTIRIANGQGFWGDSVDAPVNLIEYGDFDYLTLDYLAEVTLSIMQRQKNKNPNKGYATDFVSLMSQVMVNIKEKNIKVITNAGGVNPEECKNQLLDIAKKNKINIKIAIIKGDDILNRLNKYHKDGITFNNMDNKNSFKNIKDSIYSANVYIDSFCIAEALKKGADIILAGRVSDPGLTVGPAIYEFNWKHTEYDKIATATLAGHIIECGAQCSGGNYSKWDKIDDLSNIGYPIVELSDSTTFRITKPPNTGGLINQYTIIEQVLYEMGDPKNYISPDVVVDFTSFDIKEIDKNIVEISSVRGYAPTNTYKVSINYFNGYKASGQLTVSGPNALKKAKLTAKIIWDRLKIKNYIFDETLTEYIGFNSCHGKNLEKIKDDANEIVLRLSVRDKSKNKINRFAKELSPVITTGPPGITGFSGGRPRAQEIIAFWPTLIDKKLIKTKILL